MTSFPIVLPCRLQALLIAAGALFAGCASVSPPVVAPPAQPLPLPSLAAEQRWLANWFRGTPVVVVGDDAGAVLIEVPQPHAFDPGKSMPRPALAAVLDKVAESLRRQPAAQIVVAAPADGANAVLAQARAERVRDYLYTRGVLQQRMGLAGKPAANQVRLQMVVAGDAAATVTPPAVR